MGDEQVLEGKTPSGEDRRLDLLARVRKRLHADAEVSRLTLEQLEFIVHPPTRGCFLMACPGSGKTECVGYKLAYEAAVWPSRCSGIAVVTFTRNAAEEIRSRATRLRVGGGHPHFVGTFDSWLHSYLVQPFGHLVMSFKGRAGDHAIRIVGEDSYAPFLRNYDAKEWKDKKPKVHRVTNTDLDSRGEPVTRSGPAQDPSLRRALLEAKNRFAAAGFATYSDAVFWALRLLDDDRPFGNLLARRFPVLIVDECQDLSSPQLELLHRLSSYGVACSYVGDLNQAIYGFREVYPAAVAEHCKCEDVVPLALTRNFRSDQPIVDFAQSLVRAEPTTGCPCCDGRPRCLLWEYEPDKKALLPLQFELVARSRGIDPSKCAVVARGKATLERLGGESGSGEGIAFEAARALFLWHAPNRSGSQLREAMDSMGRVLCGLAYDEHGNSENQSCPNDIEPMVWRTTVRVFLREGAAAAPMKTDQSGQTWSIWVRQHLKPFLKANWTRLPKPKREWGDVIAMVKSPKGMTDCPVVDGLPPVTGTGIRVDTIHRVKGQTLDALLLVSSRDGKSKGGYVEQWLADPDHEYARFAFVACTRPRYLLVLATPRLSEETRRELARRGLVEEALPSVPG